MTPARLVHVQAPVAPGDKPFGTVSTRQGWTQVSSILPAAEAGGLPRCPSWCVGTAAIPMRSG